MWERVAEKAVRFGFRRVTSAVLLGGAGIVAAAATAGCDSGSSSVASTAMPAAGQCRSTADCATGQQCAAPPSTSSASPTRKIAAAPVPAPCMLQQCTGDGDCGAGRVCEPGNGSFGNCFGNYCVAACTETSCLDGTQCLANGHCAIVPCTDPEFVGCPALWYCDAEAAAAPSTSGGLQIDGSTSSPQPIGVLESGCRQLRCDEPEGPSCVDGWECNTAAASAQSVGCVALPCEDIGRCSNDDYYTCVPTSENTRNPTVDPHGCAYKNCEEGLECGANQVCDFSREEADVGGCSFLRCDEPNGGCVGAGATVCDPESMHANVYGCRAPNCTEGFICDTSATCDPSNDAGGVRGCVPDSTNVMMPGGGGTSAGTGAGGQVTTPNPSAGTTQTAGGGNSSGGALTDLVAPPGGTSQTDPIPTRPDGAAEGGACTADADCRQGYCVLGACRNQFGTCGG